MFIEAEIHVVAVIFFREVAVIFLPQLTFRHKKAFPVWASLLLHLTGEHLLRIQEETVSCCEDMLGSDEAASTFVLPIYVVFPYSKGYHPWDILNISVSSPTAAIFSDICTLSPNGYTAIYLDVQ